MADGELLDAREAMSMLGINEGELQTLVARGDLRAFRSAGTMKFRRDDVVTLKSEKGTEPTIIIPAASGVRKSASGILPAIPSGPARPPSRVGPAAPAFSESATSDIVLDDIELMPTDDASVTNQVTAAQTALGGQTVMETAQQATGQMTVLDGNIAEAGTGQATAITGSGRRVAVQQSPTGAAPAINAPAMSRVRAAVAPGVSMATSKRTLAVYQAKSASPVWTAIAILNSVIFMLAASICGVMMAKGSYDKNSGERVIPPFLNDQSQFAIYRWCYEATPGNPNDKKPVGEFTGGTGK